MTAELDIYIKDLVRRCQFSRTEVEACKIDLLYHATVHFEVRKFVHNAKPEELTYDKMIEVAKAHERTCHEYQQHKQAHSVPVSSYQNPLIQTNAVRKSFQKTRSCGKCGRSHIPRTVSLLMGRHATAVGGRGIGQRCVEQGETLQPDAYTITTPSTGQTEKTIGQQAIQAAGWRRREGQWQVLQERWHSQQAQERRRPSQEDTLTKTGNI